MSAASGIDIDLPWFWFYSCKHCFRMLTLSEMRREFRPMLRLALPLALTELSWVAMGLVDTMMVGRLPYSAVAIGAVSLGTIFFYTLGIFGSSIMLGLDTLVSQAYGAGKLEDCHRAFF